MSKIDFKPALDVKDLPLAVQKRVKALKNVQMENVKLEEKYHQETLHEILGCLDGGEGDPRPQISQ